MVAMDVKAVCLCLVLCVAVSSAIPVVQLTPQEDSKEPQERVVVVKRSALYNSGSAGGLPCRGYSAYRCPHQDVPVLCRSFDIFNCHDTDFITVDIGV